MRIEGNNELNVLAYRYRITILEIQPVFTFLSSLHSGYCDQVLPFPADEEKVEKIEGNQTEHRALRSANCEETPRELGLFTLEKRRLTVTWQQMSNVEVRARERNSEQLFSLAGRG